MDAILILTVFALIVCGAIGGEIGKKKGRYGAGFWYGLLLGPLGIFFIWSESPTRAVLDAQHQAIAAGKKKCPACAEWIQADANLCRYCSTPLTPTAHP